jgi:1,4-dihydroxy-2-naphthoyl-CoA hydrolase
MSIWFSNYKLEDITNGINVRKTMLHAMDIKLTELGDDYLRGTMPVDERTHQPLGILHGGASCVLAETLGSLAANFCFDPTTHYAVGLDIHTSHVRSVSSGIVTGTARPINIGRSIQLWEIKIEDENGKLVSITRLTMFVKEQVAK